MQSLTKWQPIGQQPLHKKAPALLAYLFGDFFCFDKEVLTKELELFLPKLDAEILQMGGDLDGSKGEENLHVVKGIDEDRAFVTMNSTLEFLEKVGMPV